MRTTTLVSLLGVWGAMSFAGCSSSNTEEGPGSEPSAGPAEGVESGASELTIGSTPSESTYSSVGSALGQLLNQNPGDNAWKITNPTTKGTRQNIVFLQRGDLDFGMANAAITYFAVRGKASWDDEKYDVKSVVTMTPNVAQFVTTTASGVTTISDLKGKRVFVGPDGSGAEMFLPPILEAHGLQISDITLVHGRFSEAVRLLGDKSIDAAFMGVAGPVPHPLIVAAANSLDLLLIPYDEEAKRKLIAEYSYLHPSTIPAGKYKGQDEAFAGLAVGHMHLITSGRTDEELVYQVTRVLYQQREEVVKIHPAGNALNARNVVRVTGTPFHPGAIRYYKEIGIWPEEVTP